MKDNWEAINGIKDNPKKKEEKEKLEKELIEAYAEIQVHNPKAKNIEIMNDGEMMNYSGGLYGYKEGKDTVNLGEQWVGHRPSNVQVGKFTFQKTDEVMNVEINGNTVRQTDMLGKPDTTVSNLKMVINGQAIVVADLAIEDKKLYEQAIEEDLKVTTLREFLDSDKLLDKHDEISQITGKNPIEIEEINNFIDGLDPKEKELYNEKEKEIKESNKLIEARANKIKQEIQKNREIIGKKQVQGLQR